ncbi:hypothetical protein RHMOL_Rhmol11G0059000 [Rhododendron molle]|uniref:Uncharacterized protein n=1 Tax=Rhododendron molle TaxID=49168 RepID=A0ACC0LNS9_RHOML|nr:hypothetical protein RHMOL_Rhmol11G0059000 [Rhododendron molle]
MLQKAVSSLQDDIFAAKMEALNPEFGSYKPAKEEDDAEGDSDNNSDDRSDAANDVSDGANSSNDDDGEDNVNDYAFIVFDHPESD